MRNANPHNVRVYIQCTISQQREMPYFNKIWFSVQAFQSLVSFIFFLFWKHRIKGTLLYTKRMKIISTFHPLICYIIRVVFFRLITQWSIKHFLIHATVVMITSRWAKSLKGCINPNPSRSNVLREKSHGGKMCTT